MGKSKLKLTEEEVYLLERNYPPFFWSDGNKVFTDEGLEPQDIDWKDYLSWEKYQQFKQGVSLKELDSWERIDHTFLNDIKDEVDLSSDYWNDYPLDEEVWMDGHGNWKKYYQKK